MLVVANPTPPTSDRYTADFRDGGGNLTTPQLHNGNPTTLNLRITSTVGNNSTKYVALALPRCFGNASAVTLTGGSGYSVILRDGFILLQGGNLGNTGNFMTVQFTATPTGCTDGTTALVTAVVSQQNDDANGSGQVTSITGPYASVNMDSTSPTSAITFPANNGFYNTAGWTGTLTGTANDPGAGASGLANVGVSIKRLSDNKWWNGTSFSSNTEVFNTATGTSSWSLPLAASNLTDNVQYTVRSQATDIAGNVQTTPASATFTYDTTPPTSSISFPTNGAFYNAAGWTGSITGSANDPNTNASGLSSVGVSIKRLSDNKFWDGSAFNSSSEVFNTASGTSSWSYTLAASTLTDGVQYTVRSQAKDNAINKNVQTTPASVTFTYDTTPPAISVTHTANGSNGWNVTQPVTVQVAVSDGTSGIAAAPSCSIDGGASAPASGSSSPYTVQVSGQSTHTVSLLRQRQRRQQQLGQRHNDQDRHRQPDRHAEHQQRRRVHELDLGDAEPERHRRDLEDRQLPGRRGERLLERHVRDAVRGGLPVHREHGIHALLRRWPEDDLRPVQGRGREHLVERDPLDHTRHHSADGHDQPGRGPERSDAHVADPLHRRLQRARHRLHRI